ncbi:MAG: hypothetical protein R3F11_09900 [Verrucomicrobiales bacterium]
MKRWIFRLTLFAVCAVAGVLLRWGSGSGLGWEDAPSPAADQGGAAPESRRPLGYGGGASGVLRGSAGDQVEQMLRFLPSASSEDCRREPGRLRYGSGTTIFRRPARCSSDTASTAPRRSRSFAMPNPTDPAATFMFESDGIARYDIFVRENNDTSNRSRINAVRLSMIPEPGSAAGAEAGIAALTRRRRRSQGQKQRCLD